MSPEAENNDTEEEMRQTIYKASLAGTLAREIVDPVSVVWQAINRARRMGVKREYAPKIIGEEIDRAVLDRDKMQKEKELP